MRVEQNSDLDDRSCLISDALITREVVGAWIKNQQRAGRFAHVRQGDPRGLDEIGEGKPTLGVVVAGANGEIGKTCTLRSHNYLVTESSIMPCGARPT